MVYPGRDLYPNGPGNADFYISYRANGVWGMAKRLPKPINSDVTENLRLHSAGNGLGDIYFVDWKEVKF